MTRSCALHLLFFFSLLMDSARGLEEGWARQLGWDQMCARGDQPYNFCSPKKGPPRISYSGDVPKLLSFVNRQVNAAYVYMSDMKMYGVRDYWTVPKGRGADCEDYVLAKIMTLASSGIEPSSMSMLTGNLRSGGWHAVLLISTSKGDLVLDNFHDQVRPFNPRRWNQVYRMSMQDPGKWFPVWQ